MTVAYNTPAEKQYLGTDGAKVFGIDFPTFEDSNVKVEVIDVNGVVTDLVQVTDYTLQNIGKTSPQVTLVDAYTEDGSGNVVTPRQAWLHSSGNLATGYTLNIKFDTQAYQPAILTGPSSLGNFQKAIDRLTMNILAIKALASRALTVSSLDTPEEPLSFPPLTGSGGKILQVKDDETGFEFGVTSDAIFDARTDAVNAASAAATSETNAQTSATNAATSATNAATSETNAATSATDANAAKDEALEAEANAEFWAGLDLYTETVDLTFADSPYTIDAVADKGKLLSIDTTLGDVDIIYPLISATDLNWKVGVYKTTAANQINIVRSGTNTINTAAANEVITSAGVGAVMFANSPTDWRCRFFVASTAAASGGGAFIDSNYAFSGYSARFSEAFSSTDLQDTLAKILVLAYLGPQVSLSASGSGTVREKGDAVTASTLTANVTKRTDNIARIQFFLGGVAIAGADYNPPADIDSGSTVHSWTGSFSDNATFRVDVTDDGTSGGPTTVSSSASFTFVYPYFSGAAAPGRTAAQVAALTKDIRTSTATLNKTFTTANGDVYYFAYPASYGALTSILDENGFETFSDWTLRTENITGLDGTSQSYRIYEFENPVVAGSTNYTFKR